MNTKYKWHFQSLAKTWCWKNWMLSLIIMIIIVIIIIIKFDA